MIKFNIDLNEFKDPDSKSLPQFYMVNIWHEWPSVSCFHLIISSSFCLHFLYGFLRYVCIVDVFLNGQGSCMDIDLRCVCVWVTSIRRRWNHMQRLLVPLNQLSCDNQQPISTIDLIISGQYATTQTWSYFYTLQVLPTNYLF